MEKMMFEEKYNEKISHFKIQLTLLLEGKDPKLQDSIRDLEDKYNETVALKKEIHQKRCKAIEQEYKSMKDTAFKEYEEKKLSLKQNLLKHLEDDRKLAVQECQNLELTQESTDIKPVCTRRILRRRAANDLPYNGSDIKRKKQPTPDIKFHLNDKDIEEDVSSLKSLIPTNETTAPQPNHISAIKETKYVATIQEGKLLYEKRYYYRGQSIYVESSSEGERYAAIIQAVENTRICLRKLTDNSRIAISISQLHNGIYTLRKRIFN